jgi:hypothetical protein
MKKDLSQITSEKFHVINGYELFSNPNQIISTIVNKPINIFDKSQNQFLFSFTNRGNEKLERRIERILEHGTPSYVTETYPQNHYPGDFKAGDFFAKPFYLGKDDFYENQRHGDIFLIFNKEYYSEVEEHGQFRIKPGRNPQEGLIKIAYIDVAGITGNKLDALMTKIYEQDAHLVELAL